MPHFFFSSLARSRYLYLFLLSIISTLWSAGTLFLLLTLTMSGRLIVIYYYYYYYTHWEFFTLPLIDDLSHLFDWSQFYSGLHDSSKYSSWFYRCCDRDGVDFSSDLQFLRSLFQVFGDRSRCTDYNSFHCQPLFPLFFLVLLQAPPDQKMF